LSDILPNAAKTGLKSFRITSKSISIPNLMRYR
jgi:hypothetical protein